MTPARKPTRAQLEADFDQLSARAFEEWDARASQEANLAASNTAKREAAARKYEYLRVPIEEHFKKGEPLKTLSVRLPKKKKPVPPRTLERAVKALGLTRRK